MYLKLMVPNLPEIMNKFTHPGADKPKLILIYKTQNCKYASLPLA
jgi:hypothetical protein